MAPDNSLLTHPPTTTNWLTQTPTTGGFPQPQQDHVSFFADLLGGAAAVQEPTFSFPHSTARDFVRLASALEGAGVSAYLGAAGALADRAYLGAAAAVLAAEARHSAFLREALHEPVAGKPYDTPLGFRAACSLAARFIITGGGPGTAALPFSAFPPLAAAPLGGAGPVVAGESGLLFRGAHRDALAVLNTRSVAVPVYAVFYSGLDVYHIPVEVSGDDVSDTGTCIPTGGSDPVGRYALSFLVFANIWWAVAVQGRQDPRRGLRHAGPAGTCGTGLRDAQHGEWHERGG